jgi:hypothetical protein
MELLTAFWYVVIALLVLPAVWLTWFGLDELIRPARPRAVR